MANETILMLPNVPTALNGNEAIEIVQSGTSYQSTTGAIANLANYNYPTISAGYLIGNPTQGTAVSQPTSVSALLDVAFGSTQGGILYRGVGNWNFLQPASSAGYALLSGGPSADPYWQVEPGFGTVQSVGINTGSTNTNLVTKIGATVSTTSPITAVGTISIVDNPTFNTSVTSPFLIATGTVTGSLSAGAVSYGTLSYPDTNVLASFQSSVASYNQIIVQNSSNNAAASASYLVSNDAGTASTYYGEFGMNSSGFTGTGAFNSPNTVYLDSASADLAIGTTTANAIHFVVNNGTTDAATISSAGVFSLATALAATSGGTGQASYAIGDILYASTTTALSRLADVATGNALISGGVNTAPSWGKIGLTTHVSGTLPVGNGGTGATTFTANGIIYGNATSALVATAAGTTGQILIGNTSAAPSWAAATSVAVTSISFGATGLTPNTATQGAVTVAGTLATANGGTNLTTFTAANNAIYSTSASVLTAGTLPVAAGGTGATTLTLNGVLYGNGTGVVSVTAQGAANTILTANAGAPSFSATPTIGTSVTVPLVIGGTAAGSKLTLTSTSNATASGDQVLINVGNNGATTAATFASTAAFLQMGAGTSTIAPLKFTSGTNLGTAAAGVVEYDGSVYYQTGTTTLGRGYVPVTQIFKLTASGSAIGPGIANYFGATSGVSLETSAYYELEAELFFLKTTAGTVTFTLTFTQAPISATAYYSGSPVGGVGTVGSPQTAAVLNSTSTATAMPVTGTLTTTVNHQYKIYAIFQANATTGGTLNLQITSSAGTTTSLALSNYKVRRIATANVGAFA